MMNQAQNLRKLIDEHREKKRNKESKRTRVITVASGKGGVGKTNFSVNLAIALRKQGSSVTVFDADLGLANVDVIIGATPRYSLYDVIFNNKTMNDIILEGPLGIKVVPGGSGLESLQNMSESERSVLSDKFSQIKDTDILIVDTGAGINRNVLGFMAVSDEVVVVTTPEPTSITDAYSLIKVANKYISGCKIHLVINRVTDKNEAELTYDKLEQTAKNFLDRELKYLGYVIDDSKVKRAVMEQKPFTIIYPQCPASKCIYEIAASITGVPSYPRKSRGIRDFFTKMTYIFAKAEK